MQKYVGLIFVLFIGALLRADGTLDLSFGGIGYVSLPEGFYARGIAIQPDGKIVVVGASTLNAFQIVRYNNDGSLDTTFNTTSTGTGGIGQVGPVGIPFSIGVLSDGSLIAAGQDKTGSHFQLVKYTQTGIIDTTFGTAGVVTGPVGYAIDAEVAVDGKIVVVGTDDSAHLLVVRYNSNGSISNSFNVGAFGFAEVVQIQYDGKIIIAGTNNAGKMQIIRYMSNGVLDTSFGTGGIVTSTFSGVATALLIQPDGYYVVSGYGLGLNPPLLMARYTNAGAIDGSFGTGGIVTGPTNFLATCAALQSNGSIVIGGEGSSGIKLTRYTSAGVLDATFGAGGVVTGTIGDVFEVALQSNGYIVTAGMDPIASNFQVARYTGNSPLAVTAFTSANTQQTGQMNITGTAQNPSQVSLYVDGSLIDSIYTNAGVDTWTAPMTITYPGLYIMRVVASYKNANVSSAAVDELRVYGNKIA